MNECKYFYAVTVQGEEDENKCDIIMFCTI